VERMLPLRHGDNGLARWCWWEGGRQSPLAPAVGDSLSRQLALTWQCSDATAPDNARHDRRGGDPALWPVASARSHSLGWAARLPLEHA